MAFADMGSSVRRAGWIKFAWLVLAIAGPAVAAESRGLSIYWIDTEGGAATLLVTPAGESILVDTGNPGRRDPERIVKVATQVAGLRQIDHLVTTHFHGDHYGGAITLANLMPIKTVYDNGVFPGMPDNPGKAYFEFPCQNRVVLQPGMLLPLKQSNQEGAAPIRIQCIGGRQEFMAAAVDTPANEAICAEHRPKDRDGSDNANSVVLVVEYGPFRFFDAGDLTWNQEMRLVCPKNLIGDVDVYQVTHHGLDASNNPVVLKSLEPAVAIMNNGVTKGCMPEVFENLKATASLQAIYQVHKNLRPDGEKYNVADEFIANLEKDCQGHHIELAVEPSGNRYTVSIPATGHRRTFETKRRESR